MVEVVAALIWENGRFLICRRPEHKERGLLWEFAGGKVEAGETKQEALVRECCEELDIMLSVGEAFMQVRHEYPDLTVNLTVFSATIAQGEPKLLEHSALAWITPEEIPQYAFCPADEAISDRILREHAQEVVRRQLFELADETYRAFHYKLIPTVAPERVIGVRTPALRKLAVSLSGTPIGGAFLRSLPHMYYEENNLHAALLERIADFDACIETLDAFLPLVDNWATCDMLRPRVFRKNLPALLPQIDRWLQSEDTYVVRFAIEMLMTHFLDGSFQAEYLAKVAGVRSEEYYIKMMVAWYFATALAKQYDAALPYLTERRLETWTHNKTIQKAIESYRVPDECKTYLRTLKR